MTQLTFIVATDKRNYPFTLPFIFFVAKHNPECEVDVHLFNECSVRCIASGLNFIDSCLRCKVNVKENVNVNVLPQHYRFLVEPLSHSKYAYCGDIDIMICEDILPFHMNRLENGKYCYDNEVRTYVDSSKMSGLHFCTDQWYLLTKTSRQKFLSGTRTLCDEQMLKKIAEDSHVRLHPFQKTEKNFWINRPTHGQHISLSRRPFSPKCKLENILDPLYRNQFIAMIRDGQFLELMKLCTAETRGIFNRYFQHVKLNDRV